MRYTQPFVSLLVLCGALSLAGPIPTSGTETSHPQIVRVSYVQGEVKLSTGIRGSPDLGKDWIAAGVNFPIEEGATLATENGRAEVEFENGSVAYLAEHSVLQFDGLTSNSQGTNSEVTLLTGRATFAIESNGRDEITIRTTTAKLHTTGTTTLRVESALDGAMFRVVEGPFKLNEGIAGKTFAGGPGDAFQSVGGVLSRVEGPQDDPDQQAWDQWVSEERTARKADIAEGLKQSGLAAPIPGLVDLVRAGTFSDCPPYGKCWEPKEAAVPGSAREVAKAIPEPQAQDSRRQGAVNSNAPQSTGVRYERVRENEGSFTAYDGPCGWGPVTQQNHWVEKILKFTPEHPEGQVVKKYWVTDYWGSGTGAALGFYPDWWRFPWATCHAGSWLREPRVMGAGCKPGKTGKCQPPKKKWVVGPKRKGRSFLRVKVGKGEGFIPRHPLDVKGKRPLNVQDGVLTFHGKGLEKVAEIKSPPKDLQIVKSLPAVYETNWVKTLPRVERPVIEGRFLKPGTEPSRASAVPTGNSKGEVAIRYDYKARDFAVFANAAGSSRGNARPVAIAHFGLSQGNGSGSSWGSSGGNSGRSAGSHGSGSSGGSGSHGGGGGGSSSHSSSGGGGYGGGGGGGSSSGSSGGGRPH
jgi:hypothetical protein